MTILSPIHHHRLSSPQATPSNTKRSLSVPCRHSYVPKPSRPCHNTDVQPLATSPQRYFHIINLAETVCRRKLNLLKPPHSWDSSDRRIHWRQHSIDQMLCTDSGRGIEKRTLIHQAHYVHYVRATTAYRDIWIHQQTQSCQFRYIASNAYHQQPPSSAHACTQKIVNAVRTRLHGK